MHLLKAIIVPIKTKKRRQGILSQDAIAFMRPHFNYYVNSCQDKIVCNADIRVDGEAYNHYNDSIADNGACLGHCLFFLYSSAAVWAYKGQPE